MNLATVKNANLKNKLRWLSIFVFFATTPQFIFRLAGKVLRPVVNVADDIVSAVEDLGE